MSLRALGRQFVTSLRNPPFANWQHPRAEGKLFDPGPMPNYRPEADVVESGRRRNAGENNPAAPWKTPMLQHHFLPEVDSRNRRLPAEPVQGDLGL